MSDALTVEEVDRIARNAIKALHAIELPAKAPAKWRWQLDRVEGHLNELRLLCDLVRAVDEGLVVLVDREDDT